MIGYTSQYDKSLIGLQFAYDNLKLNDTILLNKITEMENVNTSKYNPDQVTAFNNSISNAKNVLADLDTLTISKMKDAINKMNTAYNNLYVDKSELEKLINDANKIDRTLYTDDSITILSSSIDAATATFEDENASYYDVQLKISELNDAISKLELKKDSQPDDSDKDDSDSDKDDSDQDNTDKDDSDQDNADKDDSDKDNSDQDDANKDDTDKNNSDQDDADKDNTDQENTNQENNSQNNTNNDQNISDSTNNQNNTNTITDNQQTNANNENPNTSNNIVNNSNNENDNPKTGDTFYILILFLAFALVTYIITTVYLKKHRPKHSKN